MFDNVAIGTKLGRGAALGAQLRLDLYIVVTNLPVIRRHLIRLV
jgi:hypothetical protein